MRIRVGERITRSPRRGRSHGAAAPIRPLRLCVAVTSRITLAPTTTMRDFALVKMAVGPTVRPPPYMHLHFLSVGIL